MSAIILGDATHIPIEPEIIDLTITSPPYDKMRDYKGHAVFDYKAIIDELFRVTKPGGVVVWVVADAIIKRSESGSSFRQALHFKEIGFCLHQTMIYRTDKPPIPVTQRRYQKCFEYMFVFSKDTPKVFNPIMEKSTYGGLRVSSSTYRQQDGSMKVRGGRSTVSSTKLKSSIWYLPSGGHKTTRDKFAFKHPAMFPEQLARNHIVTWTNPGDLVLDPMCGAGTVPKIALELGRRYIGVDIVEEYCELAQKRVGDARRPLFAI